MRHKIFCKKFKSSLILTVVAAVILSFVLSSAAIMHPVRAASSNQGSDYSAKAKVAYMALSKCIRENNGTISVTKDSQYGGLNIGWYTDWLAGTGYGKTFYLEKAVEGSYGDSVWGCSDLGKHLGILEWFGLNYKNDLLCNGDGYGILKPKENSNMLCKEYVAELENSGIGYIVSGSDCQDYLEKMFKEKVFDNNPTGGSLDMLTDLEKYYIYAEGFKTMCTSGSSYSLDSSSGGMGIPETNAKGEIEIHYYSVSDKNKTVHFYENQSNGGEDIIDRSCSYIAESMLSPAGTAVVNGLAKELGEKCQEAYTNAVNTAKGWWDEHKGEYTDAQSAVDQFFASHSATATAYAYDSSKPSFTCKANDFIDQWNTLKDQFGFTGTPNLEGYTGTDAGGNQGGNNDNGGSEATCHSESGAVGWFVCPILELAAKASTWAYDTVIEPSLRIRSDLFSTTGDSTGTFKAWSAFRDIANVIFVILLLIVILSQLTGIGIDNYGIKKTLPNLIVAAVLVNLSFIICQLLVDVSNIVGAGTYSAIEGISSGITVPKLGPSGEIVYATSIIFTICGAAAGIGVTAAVTGGFWTMISGALLAVLPAIIGAVVAILFLFFLLAMRQAIVVMLVAIAPLAFVCYTLPNTKKLFSRWAELLRAMLILYPICAVMIAGGRLASKIILVSGAAENNLFIILVAMVAEAGPLFLIPGLTRSAYRATGQLGATLNGLRTRWTGGARNRVRNSQTYQNAQARNQRRRITSGINLRRANRYNEAQERLQAGSGSYAPGFRGRARRARDYFTTRAGNTERVASINEQALAAEEQQRKINRMSNAEQVEGMRQQANIAAQQQNVRNADYANAQFANAVITQAQVEHEASHDRQMNYNNERYVRGKRNANLLALENEFYDTRMTADADIVQGKRQQARISRDATRQNIRHYNDATYQQAAAASLARKERDDNIRSRESLLANGGFTLNGNTVNGFDTGQVREALQHALGNSYTGDNREADINALVNTLSTQGDAGRSAVYEALQYVENNGGINDEARQQLSQNIMQYHAADFKNNQRSVFDYARANTGVNPGQVRTNNGADERDSTFADFNAKAANSLTQEQLVSMDEAELMRYLNTLRGRDNNGAVVTNRFNREEGFANHAEYVAAEQAAQQQVQDLAMQTLTNQDALQRLKGSQRAILEEIATLPTSGRATP